MVGETMNSARIGIRTPNAQGVALAKPPPEDVACRCRCRRGARAAGSLQYRNVFVLDYIVREMSDALPKTLVFNHDGEPHRQFHHLCASSLPSLQSVFPISPTIDWLLLVTALSGIGASAD